MALSILEFKIKNSCQPIWNSINNSSLNFPYQETPYSLYITVRKSLVKEVLISTKPSENLSRSDEHESCDRRKMLESLNERLKSNLEEEINEKLKKTSIIENLQFV
jgi:hypothetical protein